MYPDWALPLFLYLTPAVGTFFATFFVWYRRVERARSFVGFLGVLTIHWILCLVAGVAWPVTGALLLGWRLVKLLDAPRSEAEPGRD